MSGPQTVPAWEDEAPGACHDPAEGRMKLRGITGEALWEKPYAFSTPYEKPPPQRWGREGCGVARGDAVVWPHDV
jgi:hypothetical protein